MWDPPGPGIKATNSLIFLLYRCSIFLSLLFNLNYVSALSKRLCWKHCYSTFRASFLRNWQLQLPVPRSPEQSKTSDYGKAAMPERTHIGTLLDSSSWAKPSNCLCKETRLVSEAIWDPSDTEEISMVVNGVWIEYRQNIMEGKIIFFSK